MGSNKEAQAARNAADRRLRELFPEEYARIMHEEHANRGLKWARRATPEERAERAQQAVQDKARARIEAEAEKAGIKVAFVVPGEEIVDLTKDEAEDAGAEQVDISATRYDVNNPHDIHPF